MAKQSNLYLPAETNNGNTTFTSADTTTAKTVFTAGANDSNVKSIIVTSDDTAAINLRLYLTRSGTDYLLGTVNIPISSGVGGTVVSVDMLNSTSIPGLPVDNVGKRYISLKTGETLKAACLATMTAAKTCTVNCLGEDY